MTCSYSLRAYSEFMMLARGNWLHPTQKFQLLVEIHTVSLDSLQESKAGEKKKAIDRPKDWWSDLSTKIMTTIIILSDNENSQG